MLGELFDGGLKALADRPLFSLGHRANVIPLALDGLQAGLGWRQLSLIAAGQRFKVRTQGLLLLQIGLPFTISGLLLILPAGEHCIAGGAERLPQRLFLTGRRLNGRMPFRLGAFGDFNGRPQVGAVRQRLNLLDQLLAPLDFPLALSLEAAIQSLHGLMKPPVKVTAIRTVDRSQLVPLLLTAAVEPVRFPPVHLQPVRGDFKLLQLFAQRRFLFEILLTFADPFFKVGLARRVSPFAGIVKPLP